ncbi:hypothetical protein [Streptomyces lydicus]
MPVREYVEQLGQGVVPTAVAVSAPELCRPALDLHSTDYHGH